MAAPATVAALLAQLRTLQLLGPQQLDNLIRLQTTFPDVGALAQKLIELKWLTTYQAQQVLAGAGHELVLGHYVLIELLGEGGMGQVYKARHKVMGRTSAIKIMRKERLAKPGAVKRFQREVRAAAQLLHPNIVAAFDADQVGDRHMLVMEYVEGTDLARMVKQHGPLPVNVACDYIAQAALGLQHAHERGLVHRDIKPHNLLVTRTGSLGAGYGTVKILDMGLARFCQEEGESTASELTRDGTVVGTPDFIAPEQTLNSRAVDIRADLYSLGCTFYYLLAGRPPFPGGTIGQKLLKHQLEYPVPIEQVRGDVPPPLAGLIARLIAKRPEDRYQSPYEVAALLGRDLPGGTMPAPVAQMVPSPPARPPTGGAPVAIPVGPPPAGGQPSLKTRNPTGKEAVLSRPSSRRPADRSWLMIGVVGLLILLMLVVAFLVLAFRMK
jgi:serine/threonine-protein kinase